MQFLFSEIENQVKDRKVRNLKIQDGRPLAEGMGAFREAGTQSRVPADSDGDAQGDITGRGGAVLQQMGRRPAV